MKSITQHSLRILTSESGKTNTRWGKYTLSAAKTMKMCVTCIIALKTVTHRVPIRLKDLTDFENATELNCYKFSSTSEKKKKMHRYSSLSNVQRLASVTELINKPLSMRNKPTYCAFIFCQPAQYRTSTQGNDSSWKRPNTDDDRFANQISLTDYQGGKECILYQNSMLVRYPLIN